MIPGEILLLGDINIDTFWPVPEFPVPGRDGLVDEVIFEIGGAVVNSAVLLDRMGAKTRLLGCTGKDMWAERIMNALSQTTIDLSAVQTSVDSMTGINFTIVTPDGERTMFTHRGANIMLEPGAISKRIFNDASLLHISGYALLTSPQKEAAIRAVELAKASGIPVSIDSGLEPVLKDPEVFRSLLNDLTICISGPEEIQFLLGSTSPEEAAEKLIAQNISLAAIKMGAAGSLAANKREQVFMPCFEVETVDTTGAGDSFSAGMLYGWVNQLSLGATVTLASALGAMATTIYGAGMSQPTKEKVIQFLKTQKNEDPPLRKYLEELVDHLTLS